MTYHNTRSNIRPEVHRSEANQTTLKAHGNRIQRQLSTPATTERLVALTGLPDTDVVRALYRLHSKGKVIAVGGKWMKPNVYSDGPQQPLATEYVPTKNARLRNRGPVAARFTRINSPTK